MEYTTPPLLSMLSIHGGCVMITQTQDDSFRVVSWDDQGMTRINASFASKRDAVAYASQYVAD